MRKYIKGKSILELTFEALSVVLVIMFTLGFTNLVYHLAFNNPTISFGGW